jgi:hypothetical protein
MGDDAASKSIKLGGPTFFVQAPSRLWGQFRTPDGTDMVPGKTMNIYECEFMGVLYRESLPPPYALKKTDLAAYKAGHATFMADMEREDSEMTLTTDERGQPTFVTLVPLNADGT